MILIPTRTLIVGGSSLSPCPGSPDRGGGAMSHLPTPGPGRPHHPSYSDPQPGWSLFDLAVALFIFTLLGSLYVLVEVVV